MRKVNLNKISEGMILGSDIKNSAGQILISSGAALKSNHIKYLQKLGIQSILISDHIGESANKDSETDLQSKAESHLKSKMQWSPESKFENQLFQLGLNSTIDKIKN